MRPGWERGLLWPLTGRLCCRFILTRTGPDRMSDPAGPPAAGANCAHPPPTTDVYQMDAELSLRKRRRRDETIA